MIIFVLLSFSRKFKIKSALLPSHNASRAPVRFALIKNKLAGYLCVFYVLFGYLRAEPLFLKFTLFSSLSHPLILTSPVFAILKNVIALYLCGFYVLFEYLRAEPLFEKFTLISPPSHPLNLTSPIFATSQNLIVQHLCAFYVLYKYLRAESLF